VTGSFEEDQGLPHPAAAHDDEAGRVDERVGTFVMSFEPPPRLGLLLGLDMREVHTLGPEDRQGSHGDVMTSSAPEEGPSLACDMVCDQNGAFLVLPQGDGL